MGALLDHFYIVGVGASVMLGLLLTMIVVRQKRADKGPNRMMAVLVLVLMASVMLNSFLSSFLPQAYPNLLAFPEPFLLLIGPLFYYFIQSLSGSFVFKKTALLHGLPFLLVGVLFVFFVQNSQPTVGLSFRMGLLISVLWLVIYLQFWGYYFLNRKALRGYREKLKQSQSSIEKVRQAWITYCLTTLLICYSVLGILFFLMHHEVFLPINKILTVVLALILYSVGYRTFSRPEIFATLPVIRPEKHEILVDELAGEKYQKSGLSEQKALTQFETVEQLMKQEQLYLDPELDLKGLAGQLDVSPHHLSQIINKGSQRNFYDFVNHYRLEAVKALMRNPDHDHRTVLTLAFETGFNSKATFNRFFKKATRQTPSQFRHRVRGQDR